MKLDEIKKSEPESALAKEYRAFFTEWTDEHPKIVKSIVNNDGTANNSEIEAGIGFTRSDGGIHHLVFPMKKSWWTTHGYGSAISASNGTTIIVDDFKEFPDCEFLNLWKGVEILSFEGIENNIITEIGLYDGIHIRCGLLRILKMPHLKIFKMHADGGAFDAKPLDKKLAQAVEIVRKHLKTKDISECMDELIEAGLKEYAKL
jgi:hypothetical protein